MFQRLDRLTQEEARVTVAQTLGVVHGLIGSVKAVIEGVNEWYSTGFGCSSSSVKRNKHNETFVVYPSRVVAKSDDIFQVNNCDGTFNTGSLPLTRRRIKTLFGKHDIKWKTWGRESTLLSAIIQDIEHMHAAGLAMLAYYYLDF